MKFLLLFYCLLPSFLAKPAPFYGFFDDHESHGIFDEYEWSTSEQHDCALHLHDTCVSSFLVPEVVPKVQPSFETCGILDLMNCLEREVNATAVCHHNGTLNHTRVKSVKFHFAKAKKCPCAEDIDSFIEMLVDPENAKDPDVFVFGEPEDEEDGDWYEKEDDADYHDDDYDDDDYDDDNDYDDYDDYDGHDHDDDEHDDGYGFDDMHEFWWDYEEYDNATQNGTDPWIEEETDENNTKELFKGHAGEGTVNVTIKNTTGNATDALENEMNDFLVDLIDVLGDEDDWTDWAEDNEDDVDRPVEIVTDKIYGKHYGEDTHDNIDRGIDVHDKKSKDVDGESHGTVDEALGTVIDDLFGIEDGEYGDSNNHTDDSTTLSDVDKDGPSTTSFGEEYKEESVKPYDDSWHPFDSTDSDVSTDQGVSTGQTYTDNAGWDDTDEHANSEDADEFWSTYHGGR